MPSKTGAIKRRAAKIRAGRRQTSRFDIPPTPERRAHGPIERVGQPIIDPAGGWSRPLRAVDSLAAMLREGSISDKEKRAGDHFHSLFRAAALDQLQAADTTRVGVILAPQNGGYHEIFGNEAARLQIAGAIDALGGRGTRAASCAWHVLGCEITVARWALDIGRVNRKTAAGILLADLGILERYFFA
jgi:hypothetical protein